MFLGVCTTWFILEVGNYCKLVVLFQWKVEGLSLAMDSFYLGILAICFFPVQGIRSFRVESIR